MKAHPLLSCTSRLQLSKQCLPSWLSSQAWFPVVRATVCLSDFLVVFLLRLTAYLMHHLNVQRNDLPELLDVFLANKNISKERGGVLNWCTEIIFCDEHPTSSLCSHLKAWSHIETCSRSTLSSVFCLKHFYHPSSLIPLVSQTLPLALLQTASKEVLILFLWKNSARCGCHSQDCMNWPRTLPYDISVKIEPRSKITDFVLTLRSLQSLAIPSKKGSTLRGIKRGRGNSEQFSTLIPLDSVIEMRYGGFHLINRSYMFMNISGDTWCIFSFFSKNYILFSCSLFSFAKLVMAFHSYLVLKDYLKSRSGLPW